MPIPEKIDLSKLRQAQHALQQLIAAGFDVDGSHRAALNDLDRVITRVVASRWRGVAQDSDAVAAVRALERAA
jgi:hypothetical protein